MNPFTVADGTAIACPAILTLSNRTFLGLDRFGATAKIETQSVTVGATGEITFEALEVALGDDTTIAGELVILSAAGDCLP